MRKKKPKTHTRQKNLCMAPNLPASWGIKLCKCSSWICTKHNHTLLSTCSTLDFQRIPPKKWFPDSDEWDLWEDLAIKQQIPPVCACFSALSLSLSLSLSLCHFLFPSRKNRAVCSVNLWAPGAGINSPQPYSKEVPSCFLMPKDAAVLLLESLEHSIRNTLVPQPVIRQETTPWRRELCNRALLLGAEQLAASS